MQNAVYERKQNGEGFFSLPAVTYSRFGNCPANGLVTEQPQYSVIICIFSTWQNAEIKLISNGLRFIFTCPLFLAQPITFHISRHAFAHIAQEAGAESSAIKNILGHSNLATTERYMGSFDTSKTDNTLRTLFKKKAASKHSQQEEADKALSKEEQAIELLKGMTPEQIMAVISTINR